MADQPYEPFDQMKRVGPPPWYEGMSKVVAWEAAHGHDIRLKCYAEFGCQVIEPTLEARIESLTAENERLRTELRVVNEERIRLVNDLLHLQPFLDGGGYDVVPRAMVRQQVIEPGIEAALTTEEEKKLMSIEDDEANERLNRIEAEVSRLAAIVSVLEHVRALTTEEEKPS